MDLQPLAVAVKNCANQCTDDEKKNVLAYCSYMAAVDKTLHKLEVKTIQTLADELGVPQSEVAVLARKVRERRMRIRIPKTAVATQLMFDLALAVAIADNKLDLRERVAIDRLARHLDIDSAEVEEKLNALLQQASRPAGHAVDAENLEGQGFFSLLLASVPLDSDSADAV